MAIIKILDGSLPKQSAVYAGDNMTVKTSEKGIKTYWMKEATVSVQKVSGGKKNVTFDLELRDGKKLQASASYKVFDVLKAFAKLESNLNYISENRTAKDLKDGKGEIIKGAIAIGMVLLIGWKILDAIYSKPEFNVQTAKIYAYAYCQTLVQSSLKAPRTAKFPLNSMDHITVSDKDMVYTVNSYVDSQNSFGALIRTPFWCVSLYDKANDKWAMVNFKVGE